MPQVFPEEEEEEEEVASEGTVETRSQMDIFTHYWVAYWDKAEQTNKQVKAYVSIYNHEIFCVRI